MTLLRLHLALVVVATSYLTLGIFSPPDAERLWLPYALTTLVLAAASLRKEMKVRAASRSEN